MTVFALACFLMIQDVNSKVCKATLIDGVPRFRRDCACQTLQRPLLRLKKTELGGSTETCAQGFVGKVAEVQK